MDPRPLIDLIRTFEKELVPADQILGAEIPEMLELLPPAEMWEQLLAERAAYDEIRDARLHDVLNVVQVSLLEPDVDHASTARTLARELETAAQAAAIALIESREERVKRGDVS